MQIAIVKYKAIIRDELNDVLAEFYHGRLRPEFQKLNKSLGKIEYRLKKVEKQLTEVEVELKGAENNIKRRAA